MSSLKELFCYLVLLCVSVLPVLPQNCDQFTIQPPVGPGMPLVIPEGGSVTLTCSHVSRPPFTVNWYRDVTVIRPDNGETMDECGCQVPGVDPTDLTVTERELIFTNFAPMFAGEYSCRAPNNFTAGTFNICRFDVLVPEAPSIEPLPQQNHTVAIDATLTIPVTVVGVPTPTISWRNSSTELVDGGRVDISDTGSLTVAGIKSYDRGNYSLSLTNVGGNLTRYFSVFVPFVEVISISDPEVSPNQISVTCTIVGYPNPSVEWLAPSSGMVTSNIRTTVNPETYETTVRATITVSRNCQGSYRCRARNTDQSTRITTIVSDNFCDRVPQPPPQPTDVVVMQNGQGSVRIFWAIADSNLDFMFDVCYNRVGSSSDPTCLSTRLPKTTREYSITSGLVVGVNYTFQVVSVSDIDQIKSAGRILTLSPCIGEVSVQVYGVSVNTAVNEGERTFNITWREVQDDSDVFGYKVEETKRGWTSVVNQRVITNLVTPANFCNGEDHSFVVMAINNCGLHGPPSAPVIGKCESPGRIKITGVTLNDTYINVTWALKASASSYSVEPPLSITVLEIQIDSNGQQLQFNYSTSKPSAECLGGLKPSTTYKVCLHPVYSDGLTEIMPVCVDATTKNSDGNNTDSCRKPESTTKQGTPFEQALLPDYAIAVIVIGALILLAVVFCGIGVCFACSNSKSKDIDDIGSEYSSSIAAGMGMQGRMSSNHNRNMSPTRSCLSYHSKGHSTNWQDHMGTLREMETEVGTNV